MVESQKEAAATATKSSLLDEDIGKDFFSSWKPISGGEDDGLDFGSESLLKGKKSNFSFDRLDMDFGLDGDFDKISSSFKVDLDFSCPPRRSGKANERTGKESSSGKHEDKQDRFSFNFDFNVLDSFDLDSSLMKGETKSDRSTESADENGFDSLRGREKKINSRSNAVAGVSGNRESLRDANPSPSANAGNLNVLDSFDLDSSWMKGENKSNRGAESSNEKSSDSLGSHEKDQSFRSNLTRGVDAFEGSEPEKFPTLKSVGISKIERLTDGSRNRDSIIGSSPSTSSNFGKLNEPIAATSPGKEKTRNEKVMDKVSQQSKRTATLEPNSQHTTQSLCIPSVSIDDSILEAVPELMAEFSSLTEVNTAHSGEQDAGGSFNLECSSPMDIRGGLKHPNKEVGEKSEDQNSVPMGGGGAGSGGGGGDGGGGAAAAGDGGGGGADAAAAAAAAAGDGGGGSGGDGDGDGGGGGGGDGGVTGEDNSTKVVFNLLDRVAGGQLRIHEKIVAGGQLRIYKGWKAVSSYVWLWQLVKRE